MQYLDETGVNQADREAMTAAHWSAFHDHAKHLDLLINAVGDSVCVCVCVLMCVSECVICFPLFRQGARLDLVDEEGRTPLHWTATNQTQVTCNVLLVARPDLVNTPDTQGRTGMIR